MKDVEPSLQKQGNYLEAWNAVMQNDDHYVFTNEHSNALSTDFGGKVVGYVRVPDRNQTIFFVKKGASSELYIFHHDTGEKQFLASDTTYGCTWNFDECETIMVETKKMQPCDELVLYWSSKCTYYYLNVDEVLNPLRASELTCEDFLLMKCICGPMVRGYVLENAGKDIPAGAYQFAVQLQDKDGNTTNWFMVGEPTYLRSENNAAGEPSPDGLTIAIDSLDDRYTRANVAVVRTVGGATQAFLITSRTYNSEGISVEYTSVQQHKNDIPLEEILIKRKTYIRGRRLFQKDGRLFLYQLQQDRNLNYQRIANQITTRYRTYKVPAKEAHRFKSLMRDEVYAFGIIWKYCDGTYSPVFHIPNNVAKPEGNAESCSDCEIPIWLKQSTAVREEVYCPDDIGYPLDEICYCPPNAECDGCTVIIGEEPDDEEEDPPIKCFQIVITNIQTVTPAECNVITVEFDVIIDGVAQTISYNFSASGTDTHFIYRMNYTESFAVNNVRTVAIPDGCTIDYSYFVGDCIAYPGVTEGEIAGRGLYDNSGDDTILDNGNRGASFCGSGGCGGGSSFCSGGSCTSGSCSGSGCRGGGAGGGRGGDIPYNYDPRPDFIHQKQYDKETCSDAGQFTTENGDIVNCAECAAGPAAADGPIVAKKGRNYLERLRDLLRKDDDVRSSPSLNTASSIADAASMLCGPIENLERQKKSKALLVKTPLVTEDILAQPDPSIPITNPCKGTAIYAADGCTIIGFNPPVFSKGRMGYWESCELYPLDKDCDGEYIYGELAGTPVKHHKTPDAITEPIFQSRQTGVENFMEPDNFPTNDTDVFILAPEFGNIVPPADPPKPLCTIEPYRIVMAKREGNNRSVIAKGMFNHTFKGNTYGKDYAVQKHGANSFEYVDRYIENGTAENHLGEKWATPIFAFHSPDPNTFDTFLNPNYVKLDAQIHGVGWKYGNYAEGFKTSNPNVARKDRRGVRQALNLNRWTPISKEEADTCVEGITYAPENSIIKKAEGIDFPILHKYREKCIYLQTRELFPAFTLPAVAGKGGIDPYIDFSFIGDGVDHPQPINVGVAHYGALKSYNKCQYGNIENLTYVGTSIEGTGAFAAGFAGDTSIGLYSFKKSGYVSNKVGDVLNEQFADIAGGRITRSDYLGVSPRSVCMPANRNGANLEEDLGMFDHTSLPTTGDTRDPKNMASLHPTRRWNEVFNQNIVEPESDVFYPRTVTTLIHFWCESEINQYYRQSGNEELGEIFYGKLKGRDLDSEMPASKVADNGWLNDFHEEQVRISKTQLATRAAIRTFIKLGLPAIFASMFANTETGLELASTLSMAPIFMVMWLILERFIGSLENINKMLGIKECKTDETGVQEDENIKGWKDNWHKYNTDYSKQNDINLLLGLPAHYNTCKCDDCEGGQYTNEIYYSNKQAIDSSVDAYVNFNANDYLNIPASAGRLQNLFIRQNRFYAHTTDALWLLQYANTAVPTDNGVIILGSGDLLNDPNQILEGVMEGYGGIQHPKSAINTQWGYFFVDEEAKKIYRFAEDGLKEINSMDSGMFHFFKRHLLPCTTSCSEIPYKFGVDYELNRLLFSNGDYTISYDPTRKTFISFHSYIPELFVFDRYNLFSLKGSGLWKHGDRSSYQTFYGEHSPFSVEFAANQAESLSMFPFIYESTILDVEANRMNGGGKVYNLPITFDQMHANNTHQHTGLLEVITRDPNCPTNLLEEMKNRSGTIDFNRDDLSWKFNDIKNFTKDPSIPLFLKDECSVEKYVNNENIDCTQSWDKTQQFKDKYLVYKFIFSKFADVEINLKSVYTRVKNTEEYSNG